MTDNIINPNDTKHPHMGALLEKVMNDKGIIAAAVADGMGRSHTSILNYKKQHSLQGRILWKLGLVMKHNFFADLSAQFPIKSPSADELAFQEQLLEKEQRIRDLEKEVAIYKEIVLRR